MRNSTRRRKRCCRDDDLMTMTSSSAKITMAAETADHRKCSLAVFGTPAYSSYRTLTSSAYVRRLQLSRCDAAGLFPEVRKTMDHVFAKTSKKRGTASEYFKAGIDVYVQDAHGRRWPVVLEMLRTARQRHVRLSRGWTEVCRANGICVSTSVRFDRWEGGCSSSHEPLVTVSIN